MSFQPQPTKSGTYRVKVFNSNDDRYWKFVPDTYPWIQLATVDKSSESSSIQSKVMSSRPTIKMTTD